MGIFQSIVDIGQRVFSSLKVTSNALEKFRKELSQKNIDLQASISVGFPRKEIADIYHNMLEAKRHGARQFSQYIEQYDNIEKLIHSHNDSIRILENDIERCGFDYETIMVDPLSYNLDLLSNFSGITSRISEYQFVEGKPKDFLNKITNLKNKHENLTGVIASYCADSNACFSKCILIENPKPEVISITEKMRSLHNQGMTQYDQLLKDFDGTNGLIASHNQKVKHIQGSVSAIRLNRQEILQNPLKFDFDSLFQYQTLVAEIQTFGEVYDAVKTFLLEYRELTTQKDEIISQYKEIRKVYPLVNGLDDFFYDGFLKEEKKRLIAEIRAYLEKCPKLFYDLSYLDHSLLALEQHNDLYLQKHLNDSIFNNINGKNLDIEQRKTILMDERSNLTIAGAGSGKTLTICGKVKFLLENQHISKDEILLLSYSKNSAEDLKKKIDTVAPDIEVKTFHALGLDILTQATQKRQTISEQFDAIIEEYFSTYMFQSNTALQNVFRYYASYLSANDTGEKKYATEGELFESLKKSEFTTLKKQLLSFSNDFENRETIKKEIVKSYEEMVLANFYFVNGIKYEYEAPYMKDYSSSEKRQYTPDFKLTDYNIYHEHYGIDKNGKSSQFEANEARIYMDSMEWKKRIHRDNGTICIETYSYEFENGTIFTSLKEQLKKYGVDFSPLGIDDIRNALNSIYSGQSFKSFICLVKTFISLYKARFRTRLEFENLKTASFRNEYERYRAMLFIDICADVYDYYFRRIRGEAKIDFDDMILQATDVLTAQSGYKYKYIVVDEFQDISYSRMQFLKELIRHGQSKLFAVGDDWQAIYRFAGCDINIFLRFTEYFDKPVINFITTTHRNSSELQTVVEPFITANPEQYKKHLQSALHLENPVKIIFFENNKIDALYGAFQDISSHKKNAKVLILGRNRKDFDLLASNRLYRSRDNQVICEDFPALELEYKTVHGAKGLEQEYVILINAENSTLGFPNKIEDDPLLALVLSDKSEYLFAEERRLFYVALTRARKNTYILVDVNRPSEFISEIEDQCQKLNPELIHVDDHPIYCPGCRTGKLLIRENSNGKKFYGCSNYPYCTFTANDIKMVNSNNRCPVCGDFLIKRKSHYGSWFLGCHNYPRCTYTNNDIHFHNDDIPPKRGL